MFVMTSNLQCKSQRNNLNFFFLFFQKLERRSASYELVKETMSPRERQLSLEVLYMEYMSSEESEYEDEEDVGH